MSKPLPARRVVALFAAYVVALQALLLPLSVAVGNPLQASLCSQTANGAPGKHDTGCPCAAGCGMQCCAQCLLEPPQISVMMHRTGVIAVAAPVTFDSFLRIAQRGPQIPRAPPAV
jgi:hypothetical protein